MGRHDRYPRYAGDDGPRVPGSSVPDRIPPWLRPPTFRGLMKYYALRRFFVYADEWATYFTLLALVYSHEASFPVICAVLLFAIVCNGIGYRELWRVETRLHQLYLGTEGVNTTPSDQPPRLRQPSLNESTAGGETETGDAPNGRKGGKSSCLRIRHSPTATPSPSPRGHRLVAADWTSPSNKQ